MYMDILSWLGSHFYNETNYNKNASASWNLSSSSNGGFSYGNKVLSLRAFFPSEGSLCQKWSILLEHSDFPFRCIHWILSFKSQMFWSTGALCIFSWLQLTLKQTLTCAFFLPPNYCNDLDFALTAPSVSRTVYQEHTQTQHHSFRCEEYLILILRHVC